MLDEYYIRTADGQHISPEHCELLGETYGTEYVSLAEPSLCKRIAIGDDYLVWAKRPYFLYFITRRDKSLLPRELEGTFTDVATAEAAINRYISKEKETDND